MFFLQRSFNLPLAGFVFSVIGALYSLLMALGIGLEAVCLTSGCSMVRDFKLLGMSPWWWAFVAFIGMAALCMLRLRVLAYAISVLLMLGDCVFLVIMFFIAPCTSCLIAALLIFCVWSALRANWRSLVRPRVILVGALGGAWFLLFFLNAGFAVEEMVPGWRMTGNPEAKITVYFSPSCPACVRAVSLLENDAVFYPVAEGDKDIPLLADLEARLESGQSLTSALADMDILQKAGQYAAPDLGVVEVFLLRMKSMRNQARVSRLGYASLPVIMFEGLPASWVAEPGASDGAGTGGAENPGSNYDLPIDFGKTQQCGGADETPCD